MNYQMELEKIIGSLGAEVPKLLLHSCCAPCSSYCMEYLCRFFRITVFYYNPNISQEAEYQKRLVEEKRLIADYNAEIASGLREGYAISVIDGEYHPEEFYAIAKGYENCKEGGERCFRCYELRLRKTLEMAEGSPEKFTYFTTTLTISPLKNAQKLNEIGQKLAAHSQVKWLPSDFKKKNGYKRSIELSAQYGLYRQDYCGCSYSKAQREEQKKNGNSN